jgi:aldehyde:ferredoxin oxidoreductase
MITDESHMYNIIDSLIVCKFSRGTYYDGWKDLVNYYTLATGIPITVEEMMLDGDRIENLAKLFNLREGKGTRKYDDVPYKIKHFPVPDEGPAKGVCVSDEEMAIGLDDYYASRGWTPDGIPTLERLQKVGLGEYAYIAEKAQKALDEERKAQGGN